MSGIFKIDLKNLDTDNGVKYSTECPQTLMSDGINLFKHIDTQNVFKSDPSLAAASWIDTGQKFNGKFTKYDIAGPAKCIGLGRFDTNPYGLYTGNNNDHVITESGLNTTNLKAIYEITATNDTPEKALIKYVIAGDIYDYNLVLKCNGVETHRIIPATATGKFRVDAKYVNQNINSDQITFELSDFYYANVTPKRKVGFGFANASNYIVPQFTNYSSTLGLLI